MLLTARGSARNPYLLLVLSVFDALATDCGIRLQLIQEANPIAKALYESNIVLFYGYKTLLPLLLLFLLRYAPERPIVRFGTALAAALYAVVAIYHVVWIAFAAAAP
ncbi:DUF5658 family protein [Cohnella ginsengisoli]|uniref:DUF5658 family protein n=1 Tax=Cohnella ginsengisoli TaxID=425004 RepID=A0A9X4KNH7_9BACL|nr:DUF5658 family protein [Cohnella ginsengisoli]MDG0795205.1 DUF5658 family protein [Cohnella ginsengisoli]